MKTKKASNAVRALLVSRAVNYRLERNGCNSQTQESSVIYAKQLLSYGVSGATAVQKGIELGLRLNKSWDGKTLID